jgi:hypothetical protein
MLGLAVESTVFCWRLGTGRDVTDMSGSQISDLGLIEDKASDFEDTHWFSYPLTH